MYNFLLVDISAAVLISGDSLEICPTTEINKISDKTYNELVQGQVIGQNVLKIGCPRGGLGYTFKVYKGL